MSFLRHIFGAPAPKSTSAARQPTGLGVTATRAQLVRMAHRDTLRRHGIPEQWLAIELSSSRDSRGSLGVHSRIVVRNGDASLVVHLPQILKLFRERLLKLDQSSSQWHHGASLRFELPEAHFFQPMPPVGFWRDPAEAAAPAAPKQESVDAKEWLDRMFAAAAPRHRHADFSPTQPMYGHDNS